MAIAQLGMMGSGGSLAAATPFGAAAQAAAAIAATPNTSASGDIGGGTFRFEGVNFGFSPERLPWYVWAGVAAVVLAVVLRGRK